MLDVLLKSVKSLNNSKFFAGMVMVLMNISSKYVTIKLSKNQEAYLRNTVGRQMLIFAISWMGSKDIVVALGLTAVFKVLTDHLFNEESKFCIIPKKYRRYEHLLDLDEDGNVTEKEIQEATAILAKAKKKYKRQQQLRNLNKFKSSV